MYHRVLGRVALLALVFAVGCTAKKKETSGKSGPGPAAASTPEDAFKQFQQANADQDMKAMAALMTPGLIDKVIEKTFREMKADELAKVVDNLDKLPPAVKAQLKPWLDTLARHGVTAEEIKKAAGTDDAAKALAAKVTDKRGLLVEMGEEAKKLKAKEGPLAAKLKEMEKEEREATLAAKLKEGSVKTQGDTAEATLVHKKKDRTTGKRKDKETEDTIKFKKIDGNWRIDDFPMDD